MLEDLTNNQGFLRALALVLRLKPGGLLFAGVPCNSFAFMSQGGHKRSQQAPMGAPVGFVVQGNILAARSCLLFLVALVRSTVWALENPARSSIISFPYVEKMLGLPLFRHTSVFWWSSQLHSNTSCACCHDLAGLGAGSEYNKEHQQCSGGWVHMATRPRSRSWAWAMCAPARGFPVAWDSGFQTKMNP